MLKRMTAWILVVALLASVLPMGIAAETETTYPAEHSHTATQHDCAHCDDTITWEAWGDTDDEKKSLPKTSGHYYLVSDITKTGRTEMEATADTVLCLNGYTIDGNNTDTIYRVVTSGKLRIDDCTAYTDAEGVYHAGKLINGKTTGGVGGTFYVNGTSTLTMTAGIISGSKNERTTTDTGYGGGALHLREKAQVTLENVVFENCSATKDGGIISKRDSGSKLTAKNCTFKGSTATTQGGAAYITGGGATFEKCIFTGNTANTGSALYLHTAGKVTLKDCVFEKNTAKGGASGTLYLYNSDVEMDGCTIKDNIANGNGGSAIYMTYESSLSLKDCTLTGNNFTGTSTSARGAIYVTKAEDKVTVSGQTVIEGNYAATDGTPVERGIFLQAVTAVDVGGLTDGAKITIRTNKDQTTTNMVTAATAPTNWSRTWVVCENNGMAVVYDAEDGFDFAVYTDHIHCECGNSACTDAAHKKVAYIAWNDAVALPTSGNYYLNTDVTLAKETSVNADLNLCLNGHTVTAAKDKRHISTPDKAVLTVTITDCTAQTVDGVYKAGKLTGGVDLGKGQGGGAIYIRTGGTLKVYDGIFANNTSITGGGAIRMNPNTTLFVYDGEFTDNTAVLADGKTWRGGGAISAVSGSDVQILGGTFTDNKGSQGGAIYSEGKKLVVKDAVIADNYAYSNAGGIYVKIADTTITNTTFTGNYGTKDGGAVYYREGKIDITDCVFTDNESKTVGSAINFSGNAIATITGGTFEGGHTTSGGAVFVQGGASVTVTGGTYKNNTVTTYGGAFSLYNGSLTVSGSQITGNTAKRGGAIDLRETSALVLKDCSITGNTASSGGAVYVNGKSSATLEGAPQIMANQGGNLHLMDAKLVQVGTLTDKANVCVAGNPGAFTKACDDYSKYFAADSKYLKVEYVDGALHLVAGGEHKHCLCGSGTSSHCTHTNIAWVAWEGTTSLPTSGSYYLLYDVQLSDEVSISKDLNLCLNGHTITAAKDKRILSTDGKTTATISITDCTAATVDGVYTAGKLTGGHDMGTAGGGAIYLRAGGNLDLYEGIITGNKSIAAAGALLMTTNTVFNMYGGEFSDNTAVAGETVKSGGAIYAMKGAKVNILGGTFKNNSGYQGGAIWVDGEASKLTVSGGIFTENTATVNGAAIYGKGANVTISGGIFTGNTSVKDGGAVYSREGNLDISGDVLFTGNKTTNGAGGAVSFSGANTGTISGGVFENNEGGSGGAMIIQGKSNITITDATIRNNISRAYGGAVYIHNSTTTITGGLFSGNTADDRGGAVYASNESVLTITGGTFEKNHAAVNGGGIYAKVTDMKITGGQIINNTSLKDGAGVYYREGNMDISGDVLISGNESKTAGGGVCYSGKATGTISGGVIEKNKAGSGAGMIVQGEANVVIDGGSIQKNTASGYGGGIFVYDSNLKLSGGSVTGNNAKVGGGGFYVNQAKAKVIIDGGTVSKNSTKNGAGFLVVNKATLELKSGKITGNTTQKGSGGGAYISTNSFFKMTGGSISGNVVTGAGAGLYGLRSTLTITGGSVSGNRADGAGGGGIYLNGATFRASGLSITGNTTKGNGGGVASARNIVKKNGVETSYSCYIYLSGCYIANNTGKIAGGVIMNGNGGKLEMYSTTITGNKATNQAGGLYISAKCTGTIKNSNISNNEAEKTGGGVYMNKLCQATFEDCKFHDNTALAAGGAVYLYRRSTAEYTNCSFVGNTAGGVGGAFYADGNSDYDSVTTFIDCDFAENTSATRGGAFYGATQNEFTAIRCTFTNNTAEGSDTQSGNGGAIAVRDIAYLEDCTFTGNKAELGGAFYGGNMDHPLYSVNGWGYKGSDVSVDIINCTFTDNDATRNGGAIFNAMSSFATLQNVTITGNTAGEQGSGIYAEEDLTLQDVTVTGNVSGSNGHALFLADSEYDGQTYIRGLFKFGGDIIITDNEGGNLYLDSQVTLNATYEGFGPKTHMDVVLDKGVLTQRVYGAYNYEGGNQVYTITYGDRSLTDPEIDESLIQEDTAAEQTDDGKAAAQDTWLYVGVGVIVVAILAVVASLLLKKKKAGKPAEASKE